MADVQKTIEIIFGSTDNTTAGFSSVKGGFSDLDAQARALAQPFADITKGIIAIDTALLVMAATMTAISINQASDFEDSMREIGSLFNGTKTEVEDLGTNILDFARDSGFAITDINAAVYTAISTGTDWTDALDLLGESQRLAVVGVTGLGSATEVLARALNAYGAEVTEADRYSEALFTTVQNGDTTLEKLSKAFGLVLADAAAANVPIEVLGASVAALTVGSVDTNRAMTLLKQLFAELLDPSDELKEAMGGLNFEGDNLQAVMQAIQTATGGGAEAMGALFSSIEAQTAATILANDKAGTFASTLDAMDDSIFGVAGNYDTMAERVDLAVQAMQNSLQAAFIDFGKPLLDEYGEGVTALGTIFDEVDLAFKEGVFDGPYGVLEEFIGNFAEQLGGIATALPEALENVDFSGLTESLEGLVDLFGEVFVDFLGDIDLTKPEDLATALQTGVNILEHLVEVTGGIIEYFRPIFQAIGEAASQLGEANTESDTAAGKFLAAMTALANFGIVAAGVLVSINESGASIGAVFNVVGGAVGILINTVQTAFGALLLTLGSVNLAILEALRIFAPFSDDLDGYLDGAIASTEGFIAKQEELVIQNTGELVGSFETMGQGLIELGTGIDIAAEGVGNVATKLGDVEGQLTPAQTAFNEMNAAITEGSRIITESGTVWGDLNGYMVNLSAASEEAGANVDLMIDPLADTATNAEVAATSMEELTTATGDTAGNLGDIGTELTEVTPGMGELATETEAAYTATQNANGEWVITGTNMAGVKTKADEMTTSMEEAKTAADDTFIKLQEIASDERIKNMEANVELNIAQIEADTAKALAAFESINTGITSTGEVITEALGILGGLEGNTRVYNDILDIVEAEYELRVAAFEATEEYTKALTANLIEKTKALAGGLKIEITADGMEHEIEAFMFQIIKRIHAKALGDEAEFLLAIPG